VRLRAVDIFRIAEAYRPGQRYRHGWIPTSPLAVLPPDAVDDEYGRELDSVDFGDAARIVARERGITVESESGEDTAVHSAPSAESANRWADAIDGGETYVRPAFAAEPHEGGMSVRFGDHEADLDDDEAADVAQTLRDMVYLIVDNATNHDDPLDEQHQYDGVTEAAGHDVTPGHDELHHYWLTEGLPRWAESPKPWTTLVALLTPHVGPVKARVFASRWFIEHFHYAAGSDLNRVAHGQLPRGERIGPG